MCHPDDVQTLWRHGVLLGQTNDTIATIAIRMYTQILVVTSLFTFLYIVDKGELKKGKTRRYQTAVCVSVIYFFSCTYSRHRFILTSFTLKQTFLSLCLSSSLLTYQLDRNFRYHFFLPFFFSLPFTLISLPPYTVCQYMAIWWGQRRTMEG